MPPPAPLRKITDPARLVALIKAGHKRRTVARLLGCSINTVSNTLKRLCLCPRPRFAGARNARALDRADETKLLRMIQEGHTRRQCAEHFCCSQAAVWRTLARLRRDRGVTTAFVGGGRTNMVLRCQLVRAVENGATTAGEALRACGRCWDGGGLEIVNELIAAGRVVARGCGRWRKLEVGA